MQTLHTLIYISYFSACIPLFLTLSDVKKLKEPIIALLNILIFVAACSDLISYILIQKHQSSILVTNIYFIAQLLLLNYIFTLLLPNKKFVYTGALLFVLFTFYISLNIQGFAEYQSWTRTTGGVILLTYSVLYYRQLLITLPAQNISQYAPFWINTAVSLYFSFNLFLFIIANYVFTNLPADAGMLVWGFHNVNNILKNILFAVGIYYAGKKQEGL
ncbi:MAG TPA: hypothetical protein VFN30_09145 [Chitinophagaceae bacterium]|nr:hypothetical protein [Chitinophagaceae bacterium]